MKNPLDYSEKELKNLSTDELQLLYLECQTLESLFNTEQTVLKLLINSLYGALGNKWFPLFNEDIACSITGNGRYFIRKLTIYIENKLQSMLPSTVNSYVFYGDTDSIYFQLEAFVDLYKRKNPDATINDCVNWLDNFEKTVIQPVIATCIDDFSRELNVSNKDIIGVEREVISDVFVMTEKKKYFCRVRDSEGTRYPEHNPYIKIMGLDIIKSSTSTWAKSNLIDAIPHIFDKSESELKLWLKGVKSTFVKSFGGDIANVGGVSNLDYDINEKGVPIGSRAAIRHNMYIEEHNLTSSIAPINAGDKTKRLFLQTPNKFQSNVVAFTNGSFVKELDGLIDYDTQYEKSFLKPLELMTNCLNYNIRKETSSLDEGW